MINLNKVKNKLTSFSELGILIPFIILVIVISFFNPVFLGFRNIVNVLRSISFTAIVAIGMTFVLISGGLDLSVGSIIGLGGVITGGCLINGIPIIISILAGLFIGLIIGFINGFIITRFKIPPLIVSLGMLYIARGIIYIITRGRPFYPLPDGFKVIGQGYFFKIPYSIFIMIIIAIIAHFVLNRTTFGRSVYAIGGNEETAHTSGINISKIKLLIYSLSGLLSSLTGILMTARLSSAQPNAGTGWELTVIASVIIGGTSMFGGVGSIFGTMIGVAIMSVLKNGMVLMRISVYWQNVVVGMIIILAVGIDEYRRRRITGN